jgi:hypothetical protein
MPHTLQRPESVPTGPKLGDLARGLFKMWACCMVSCSFCSKKVGFDLDHGIVLVMEIRKLAAEGGRGGKDACNKA